MKLYKIATLLGVAFFIFGTSQINPKVCRGATLRPFEREHSAKRGDFKIILDAPVYKYPEND